MARLCVNINEMCDFLDRDKVVNDLQRFGAEGISVGRIKEQEVRSKNLADSRLQPAASRQQQAASSQQLIIESPLSEDLLSYVSDNHVDTIIITDVFNSCFFEDVIKNIVSNLKKSGINVSALETSHAASMKSESSHAASSELFKTISNLGFDSVTLDCGIYSVEGERVIENYKTAAEIAKNLSLSINASHGLNMKNLRYFVENVPDIDFVIVGHEFVADALYFGLENTVQLYRRCLTCLF